MAEGVVRLEISEKKTVIVKEAGGGSGPARMRPVSITADPPHWLVSVTEESEQSLEAERSRTKPLIQRAPELLCKTEESRQSFEPVAVALGPFHHGKPRLEAMEKHKRAAAKRFVAGTPYKIDVFYNKVRDVAGEARACYAGSIDLNDEDFTAMLFFDACFLLHFIGSKDLTMSPHLHSVIVRDIFLLENQVPFVVLNVLKTLKPVPIEEFMGRIVGLKPTKETQPFHLLDLLRTTLLGTDPTPKAPYELGELKFFRSATALKEAGINFAESGTRCLRDVVFSKGYIHSKLSLPHILIDDLTRSRFLNLIALEMCPDSASNYGVTSYVWLLDCLIDSPEDVKELRSKGILVNLLGSDQQVANLFNELATDLSPDPRAYYTAIKGINQHYNNKVRVSIVRMVHTHFSSPWTTISFIAAVFLIILTVIQTVFTVFPR